MVKGVWKKKERVILEMPVQVVDIIPEEAAQEEAPPQDEAPPQEEEAPPAPKRRGRPPGSKNKPKPPGEVQDIEEAPKPKAKPPAEPVRMKRAISRKVVIKEESESEESEDEPPPSPSTQRKEQWATYRRSQVEAHQARTEHYTRALDRVLGF